jgi:hypothetical protein
MNPPELQILKEIRDLLKQIDRNTRPPEKDFLPDGRVAERVFGDVGPMHHD